MSLKQKKKLPKKSAPKVQPAAGPSARPAERKPFVLLAGNEPLVAEFSGLLKDNNIAVATVDSSSSIKSSATKATIAVELTLEWNETKRKNLSLFDSALPATVPIVTSSITETVLAQTRGLAHPERFAGIAAFPTLAGNRLIEICPSLDTAPEIIDSIRSLITAAGRDTAVVEDSVGMVMPRILCQIINEALFVVNYDIALPKDIDNAMMLGTNYPNGPIEWGEKIGFRSIVTVLDALHAHHGEERYRVSPLLRQMAVAGRFWK